MANLEPDYGIWWFLAIAAATYLSHLFLWMWPIQKSEDDDAYRLKEWTRLVRSAVGCPSQTARHRASGGNGYFRDVVDRASSDRRRNHPMEIICEPQGAGDALLARS